MSKISLSQNSLDHTPESVPADKQVEPPRGSFVKPPMFSMLPEDCSIYLVPGRTDMRKSIDMLSLEICEFDQCIKLVDGGVYVFCNGRKKLIKILYWDGTGHCLFKKRLDSGCFCWPSIKYLYPISININDLLKLIKGYQIKFN